MNTANRKRTEIDAELDRLEVEFEKNRKEMQRLADENSSLSVGNRKRRLIDETRDDPAEKSSSAGLRPETGKHIKR